jgi:hypothetical protein
VDEENLAVSVFSVADAGERIEAKIGVFFSEIMVGCSCGDNPLPTHAYCEMRVCIDKQTAQAECVLIGA